MLGKSTRKGKPNGEVVISTSLYLSYLLLAKTAKQRMVFCIYVLCISTRDPLGHEQVV
jgi:hypothetical protein